MESFEPEFDEVDKKLLFFLTGRERDDCMMNWLETDQLEEDMKEYDYAERSETFKTEINDGNENYLQGEY